MTDFILIIIFPVLLYLYVKIFVRIKAQDKEINYLYKYRDTLLKKVAKYNLPEDLFTKEQVEELKKESYNKGVEDAINICDEAIENDFSGALRNRTWIRNKLQQLKEQKNG